MKQNYKMRLIGFYNKPNQSMKEETEKTDQAQALATLLKVSFNSLMNDENVDAVFKSVLKGNTVFVLKDENANLIAYYPHRNIVRVTDVIYNKKNITLVPLMYKNWFLPGESIYVGKYINKKHYTITTSGTDFLLTHNRKTLPLDWSEDTYISISKLSDLVEDNWVCLIQYDTSDDCDDCDGYDYSNCDYSRCKNDCENCGGRRYICNNSCFNHRYDKALRIIFNSEEVAKVLEPLIEILKLVQKPHQIEHRILLEQYKAQLDDAYSHCAYLSQYINIDDNADSFMSLYNECKALNFAREEFSKQDHIKIFMENTLKYCINREDVRCEDHAWFWTTYHIETKKDIYNSVSDSFVSFDYKLEFFSKEFRNLFVERFKNNKMQIISLKNIGKEKKLVDKFE